MTTKLGTLGFETTIVEAAPGRPSVVARLAGAGGGPTLLFNGHMDVQPPGHQWTRDPFAAVVEGRRLYGQGAMDMKAGLAAIVFAVDSLQRAGRRLAGDVVITAVADEVCGGHLGTGHLVAEGLVRADMAVVCEPTGDTVRVTHRGALWLEIEVTGKSAHGGRPWLGVKAVSKAARIVTAIDPRVRLGLPARDEDQSAMSIVVERGGELYSLLIDQVGEVLNLPANRFEQNPASLDDRWREISAGVYRLDDRLLVVMDVGRLLEFEKGVAA